MLTPTKFVAYLLDRIEAAAGDNIFIAVTAERALEEARAAEKRYADGAPASLLDGVPVAWKDLFDVKGTVTTAGSKVWARSGVRDKDAACVARLSAAGMVTLGKLNTSEFAYSGLGLNPHFGTPRNPNDRQTLRSPGGSSSGSGAAVAAGLTCCAIGSDTGGSVRVPASFNGTVGLKTSTGRIDRTGMFMLARSYDTIGPLARSVEDCALLFHYLQGHALPLTRREALRDLVLLCPANIVLDDLASAVERNFHRSLERLKAQGATVRIEDVPALTAISEITAAHGTLVAAEAYHEHRELVESPLVSEIDRRVVHRILGGKRMTSNDVLTIQRSRQVLEADLRRQLAGALLVMPTTPNTAPEVAPLDEDDELFHRINQLSLRNASLGNPLELCALAIPNGHSDAGLPTSLMICDTHGNDERLLAFGQEVERALRSN